MITIDGEKILFWRVGIMILPGLNDMAFKQMECVNQMKKEFLIMVKRWRLVILVIAELQARTTQRVKMLIELLLTPNLKQI